MPNIQRLTFKLNGKLAKDMGMTNAIEEILVDSTMRMPDMCVILITDDSGLTQIANKDFAIGVAVEVIGGEDGSGPVIFKGEITALEPEFSESGTALLHVHAYDKSHRLHRGKHSRTFLQQTDTQIVKAMAQEAGLKPKVVDTGITHDFMLQNNQTNMEWLLMRAEQLDYQVYVDTEGNLHFKNADATRGGAPPDLTWGEDLISFRPRITASHQADKALVFAWDPLNKKEIKGQANANNKFKPAKIGKSGADYAKAAFAAANTVVVTEPVPDVKAANKLAEGLINAVGGDFAYAEGVCYGNEIVVVGGKVNIKIREQSLTDFSGQYMITSVRHVYRVSDGRWETQFATSGRRPDTLSYLLGGGNGSAYHNDRIFGVVPGLVTNFNDPEKLGRVKVKFPWLWNTEKNIEIESDWVRIVSPSAGAERGFYYLPEVNDEVLLAFEHGDPNRPYIIGALWNKKDKPPIPSDKVHDGSKITKRMIKSRSGHTILLDDTNGSEQIVIRDKSEKNEIVIDTKNNGITIKCQKDITLDAGGNINIKAQGGVNIESGSDTKIASTGAFKVDGKAGNEIKGARLNVDVQGVLKLKSGMIAEVKGTAVKVDGSAMVEVKGGIIKLN